MTKQELVGLLDLAINKAEALYGEISLNEPMREIIEVLVTARRRVNLEGIQ